MLQLLLYSYYPTRVLFLHDGSAYSDFIDMLGRTQTEVDQFQMTSKFFELPSLFSEGAPVYSHVVIAGNADQLSKDVQIQLARYVDGVDDPDFSRFSNYEKETLNYSEEAKGIHAKQFDKYPGAHILIASHSELSFLAHKLGVKYEQRAANKDVLPSFGYILANANATLIREQLGDLEPACISYNFKNPRSTFTYLLGSTECAYIAIWRGVKNNARVLFVGHEALLYDSEVGEMIPFKYDLISWFGQLSHLLRATQFDYVNLDLPKESQCRAHLHLAEYTEGTVREGSLLLIRLTVEELNNSQWRPYLGSKRYESFDNMVDSVGFFMTKNGNHTSVMKKQIKSFRANYEQCIADVLGAEDAGQFYYTDVQVFEQFVQHWYAMNMLTNGNGTFYALLQPDLVRTYSLMFDIDRKEYNRISAVYMIDAHVDRYEQDKFSTSNCVWQVCLILNVLLGFYVVWLLLTTRDESKAAEIGSKED